MPPAEAAHALFTSAAWPDFAAPALGAAAGSMAEVLAAERALATATAARARALTALAAERPVAGDRPAGTPGAMSTDRRAARASVLGPVSEWVVRELRVSLAVTDVAGERMLVQALTLTGRLPGVLAALEGGLIHCGHLPVCIDLLDPIADDTLRARVEAELLRWLAGRGAAGTITTPAQLRAKIHRVLLARDARSQAEELRRALATRGVFTSSEPVAGMSGLYIRLTTAEAIAIHLALGQRADALPDDALSEGSPGGGGQEHGRTAVHRRSRAEKMADVLVDLLLRAGSSTLPPVQVSLTVVAAVETLLGGDAPGEIGGQVVPAAEVRALLDLLTRGPSDQPSTEAPAPAATPHLPTTSSDEVDDVDAAVTTAGTGEVSDSTSRRSVDSLPTLDDDTYWDLVERLLAQAPDPDDLGGPPVDWLSTDTDTELGPDSCGRPDGPEPPAERTWPDGVDRSDDPGRHSGASRTETRDHPEDTATGDEDPLRLARHAVDAVGRAESALGALHRAVRSAESAVLIAQLAAEADEEDHHTTGGAAVDAARAAGSTLDALRAATGEQTRALHELLAATLTSTGGGLAHRPRLALTDALSRALVSLTDLPGLRRAASADVPLGPPPDTDGYRPSTALDRHVRTRDSRCRTPGCRRAVMTGELDHHVPHPVGPTSAANLCGLCLTDHRGKHQAPGWRHQLHPDGSYTVTTPAGLTARTSPSGVL